MADTHTEHHHHVNYFLIFLALCVCTIISIVADIFRPPSQVALIVIVLAIATAKALFVMMYFMHLKFEGKWKYVLLSPTAILALGLPLALLPDIGAHYYTEVVPQKQMSGEELTPTPARQEVKVEEE